MAVQQEEKRGCVSPLLEHRRVLGGSVGPGFSKNFGQFLSGEVGKHGQMSGELTASRTTQAIYLAIIVAAVTRICAVLDPQHSEILLHVAGFTWAAAFLGFAVAFGPLLLGSKARPADRRAPA
jgi:NnrS protein